MSRKTVKNILIICTIVVILLSTMIIADFNYVLQGEKPVFCFSKKEYKDGGTIEYIGFGYKIINYNAMAGRNDTVLGSILKRYDPQIDETKLKVEVDNKNKIYNFTGKVEKIEVVDNKYMLLVSSSSDKKIKVIQTYGTLVYKNDLKANITDIVEASTVQLRTSTLDNSKEIPEAIVEIINIIE